jgi:hypothetical protein
MSKKPAENQLVVLIKESNLEKAKAQYLLDNFSSYFKMAAEWEIKARAICVTDEDQTVEMQMARVGRLFLREKRIVIETARKSLKEQIVREGKAIDGIANVLKALIVPIEEHLERQENFAEIKLAKQAEIKRLEMDKRTEEDERVEHEKWLVEQDRIRRENVRLKKESAEKERKFVAERRIRDKVLAAERAEHEKKRKAMEDKAGRERRKLEESARIAIEAQAEKLAKERKKVEVAREKISKQREKERADKKRHEDFLKSQVKCPFCKRSFSLKGDK